MLQANSSISIGGFKIAAPPLWLAGLLPSAYFAAALLSISAFGANTPIWVSNAFAVTAMLRSKRSTWPAMLVLAMTASCVVNACTGTPIIGIGLGFCNVIEIFFVAVLASAGDAVLSDFGLWRQTRFILVCLAVPTVSAAGGAGLLAVVYGAPLLAGWVMWYLSDVSGLLIVTPLLLSWTEPTLRKDRFARLAARTVFLAGLVAIAGYLVFTNRMGAGLLPEPESDAQGAPPPSGDPPLGTAMFERARAALAAKPATA